MKKFLSFFSIAIAFSFASCDTALDDNDLIGSIPSDTFSSDTDSMTTMEHHIPELPRGSLLLDFPKFNYRRVLCISLQSFVFCNVIVWQFVFFFFHYGKKILKNVDLFL